jgi:precorrin-3B synthase
MPTGDGLLARLIPSEPIALEAFMALCKACRSYGNGIVEVTQRGSLQVRGLSPASATAFAQRVFALGLASEARPTILTAPLLGLGAETRMDARALIAALREAVEADTTLAAIDPKISLLIDGDDLLHLDEVPADLRLRWGASRFHLSIAGPAAASVSLGWTEPHRATQVVTAILRAIAARGSNARAEDLRNPSDIARLRAMLAGAIAEEPPPLPRVPSEAIHTHPLADGHVARGVALPFGYAQAAVLERFAEIAAHCGALSVRPAPGRALIAIGLPTHAVGKFKVAAAAEGLIVEPHDGRRFVIACAGAPACRSAMLSTRELAPAIAEAAGPLLDGSMIIHVSGCAKGCAHPNAAALTLVGPNRMVVGGRANDTPQGTFSASQLLKGFEKLRSSSAPAFAERSSERLSRIGTRVLVESLGEIEASA